MNVIGKNLGRKNCAGAESVSRLGEEWSGMSRQFQRVDAANRESFVDFLCLYGLDCPPLNHASKLIGTT